LKKRRRDDNNLKNNFLFLKLKNVTFQVQQYHLNFFLSDLKNLLIRFDERSDLLVEEWIAIACMQKLPICFDCLS